MVWRAPVGRRYFLRVQVGSQRWQIKDLLASLAGAARVVSCYRVSELATAPLECEQDKSGDFLLTLVVQHLDRLASQEFLVLMGRGASVPAEPGLPLPPAHHPRCRQDS